MYRIMDNEEIEIRKLSDIKMIHLYQLGGSDAIAVYYGDNRQINLCAMDKYYNLLMERVLSIYSQCEDKESIIVEDSARILLEQAVSRGDNHTAFYNKFGKKYKALSGEGTSKFASEGVIRETLIPMLKYYIKQLYKLWNVDVEFEQGNRGWQRNCVLKLLMGTENLALPVRLESQDTNFYTVKVGNFIGELRTLEFGIEYWDNRMLITFECKELSLVGENRIDISPEGVNSVTSISLGGKVIYFMNETLPQVDMTIEDNKNRLYKNIECLNMEKPSEQDLKDITIYKLPWGGYIAYREVETADNTIKRTDTDVMFFEKSNTKVCLRHFSYGLVENLKGGLKLRTDGASMRKLYFGDKHGDVETFFLPVGYYSGWDYKEFLENKYFYENLGEAK